MSNCSTCKGLQIEFDPSSGPFITATRCRCVPKFCSNCNGTGFQFQNDTLGREYVVGCTNCSKINKLIELYNHAKVPSRYFKSTKQNVSFDNLEAKQALIMVKNSFKNWKKELHLNKNNASASNEYTDKAQTKGIVLVGNPGSGKTFIMSRIIYQCVIENQLSCQFADFSTLLSTIKDAYSEGRSDLQVLRPLIEVDILVIDDLGKGKNSQWELSILDNLITERYNRKKPILGTSNYTDDRQSTYNERVLGNKQEEPKYTKETLKERVGNRIYSRLKEMCYITPLKGVDLRQVEQSEY